MPVPMPVAFIGHGSPMNTLENNDFTAAWGQFGTLFAHAEHSRAMNDLGMYATRGRSCASQPTGRRFPPVPRSCKRATTRR